MTALTQATLTGLPATIARPDYDIGGVRVGIVHLGLGAFHRAHQAVYTDAILHRDPDWGICGVSLKTPRVITALGAQEGLYTVLERSAEGTSARVIGAVRELLFLGTQRDRVIARMTDPAVRVVSLTVTEKGYCHDPATGHLNLLHPDIAHDLQQPEAPTSTIGVLAAGLAGRRAAGAGAINIVCCDNLPRNGRTVEGIVMAYAQALEPALAQWIGAYVAFPCTMVDRIVPATTQADIADAAQLLGVADAAPVVTEPFNSWVIENRFAAARPAWEDAGAQVVADVAPFETMKLRLLNGSHSTLAYLGFLAGHEFIWQASADPLLGTLIERLMTEEVIPTLTAPPGVDLGAYCAQLVARFRNPALPHRTQQIAMDVSQKLPQRLLATVRERLAGGGSIGHLSLAVAGWIRYASGVDEQGKAIAIADPLAAKFSTIASSARGNASLIADAFLDLTSVFGADLSARPLSPRSRTSVNGLLRQASRITILVRLRAENI